MKSLLKAAHEEIAQDAIKPAEVKETNQPKGEREDEIVFYAKMSNPDGIRLASDKESHEQWEVKKRNGRLRVRKTSKENLEPSYVATFKVKSENAGIVGSYEDNHDSTESFFDSFRAMSDLGMIKDRFLFPVKKVTVTDDQGSMDIEVEDVFYEVDVFFNSDGTYNNYVKIDLEMNKVLDAIDVAKPGIGKVNLTVKIMDLPFKPVDIIVSDANTTDEDKERIKKLYDDVFLTKK